MLPFCLASITFSGRIASLGNVTELITVAVWVDSEGVHPCSLKNELGDEAKASSPGVLFLGFLVGLREGIAEPRKVGGLLLAFHFSSVRQAVGMWKSRSDFQGQWKGWKTCFWFSRLSTDCHFPQPLCARGLVEQRLSVECGPGRVLAHEEYWRLFRGLDS